MTGDDISHLIDLISYNEGRMNRALGVQRKFVSDLTESAFDAAQYFGKPDFNISMLLFNGG
jgi:hypothetical protein